MKEKNKKCITADTTLDIDMSNVFVAKKSKERAFIEQFDYSSINFTQKHLGTLLGFFIVRNDSKSSENIVNFLASELKKKYFAPLQAPASEKFESTLHHINRVLEEIANVGNVEWLGTIDSAICVVNDSSINFSITGNAHIFLLRENNLINISEGLASQEAAECPLKTFVDISSGELCPGDKLIITSQELLDLVSFEELQKNAAKFDQQNFVQFIETVLTNECSLATTTIIDIAQKDQIATSQQHQIDDAALENLFSASAFEKNAPQEELQEEKVIEEIESEEKESPVTEEYTDPRTGHIHIQGNDEPIEQPTIPERAKEEWLNIYEVVKTNVSKNFQKLSKKFSRNKTEVSEETDEVYYEKESTNESATTVYENVSTHKDSTDTKESESVVFDKNNYSELPAKTKKVIYRICLITIDAAKNTSVQCVDIITNIKNKYSNKETTKEHESSPEIPFGTPYEAPVKQSPTTQKNNVMPSLAHIKQLWKTMDTKAKTTALGILLLIVVVPAILSVPSSLEKNGDHVDKLGAADEVVTETSTEHEESPEVQEETESTESILEEPITLLEDNSLINTLFLNKRQLAISKDKITIFENEEKKSYNIPSESGDIKLATSMKDLDLVFYLTSENKLFSFSPATKRFVQQHNIPEIKSNQVNTLGSYMTYIYTTDSKNIRRYARIENGFNEGENWLKKDTDLKGSTSMAIDDSIFITTRGALNKFESRKKTDFKQDSAIKVANLVYTTPDTKYMWILDKENKKLFKTKKESGEIKEEFTHKEFANATSITANEKDDKIIISTNNKILSFSL